MATGTTSLSISLSLSDSKISVRFRDSYQPQDRLRCALLVLHPLVERIEALYHGHLRELFPVD
jgi:hypothetical protein